MRRDKRKRNYLLRIAKALGGGRNAARMILHHRNLVTIAYANGDDPEQIAKLIQEAEHDALGDWIEQNFPHNPEIDKQWERETIDH